MQWEHILGFDAREMWLSPAGDAHRPGGWTEANKEEWLLRDDVDRPLSVDDSVWLSVFKADPELAFPETAPGIVQSLWSNLSGLCEHLSVQWATQWRECSLICVTICDSDVEYSEDLHWKSDLGTISPYTPASEWRLLGYDVADAWLLSGLSNCTHVSEADFQSLRRSFRPQINGYHLFDHCEDARRFRIVSNERCGDHAPFFIYGLYLIATIERGGAPI